MPIAAFVSFVILTAFTPGPNNIFCMSTAIQQGFRKTLPLCAGMLAGFFLVMGLSALFTSFLYNSLPQVEPFLRLFGAAYILYLAYSIYTTKPGPDPKQGKTKPAGFVTGMLLQCVNPKFILYCLAALSTFVLPYYSNAWVIAGFGLILIAASSSSNLVWSFFGSACQTLFTRHAKALNTIMAVLLVYCAVALFL